jgi:hypothetical protein
VAEWPQPGKALCGQSSGGLAVGLTGVPLDVAEAIDSRVVLARDRQVMLFLTLGARLGAGPAVGLVAGLAKTRWTSYTLARGWLAFRHQLSWPLMDFLADAHNRGVLRQAGATHQFRHLELPRRLATRP